MKTMESFADEAFGLRSLVAVPFSTAIPPVREYTDDEKAQLLRKANVQAYVRMRIAGVDRATVHIPSVSYSQGSAVVSGNNATGRASSVTAGGYSQNLVTGLSFECEVQDAVTLSTIWKGHVEIDGNERNQYVTPNQYYYKAVQLLVERLQEDGIARKH
jgi:hypothetical protein